MITNYFKKTSGGGGSQQRMMSQEEYRNKFLTMPIGEKRKLYRCESNYLVLDDLPLWAVYLKVNGERIKSAIRKKQKPKGPQGKLRPRSLDLDPNIPFKPLESNEIFNSKLSLWQGDITTLEIDAIVNAANERLLGGGGVDGCIHRAAGQSLRQECMHLNGANAGEAKLTCGHRLPAKYIIHTVGPRGKNPDRLRECYENCLNIALTNNLRSIAFCCISTGVFGYPNRDAAHVALHCVRRWLEKNHEHMDMVIFCTFLRDDFQIYEELMAGTYFPAPRGPSECAEEDEKVVNSPTTVPPPPPPSTKKDNVVEDDRDISCAAEVASGNDISLASNETALPSNETALPSNETALPSNETALPSNDEGERSDDDWETGSVEESQEVMEIGSQQTTSQEESTMEVGSQSQDKLNCKGDF